MCAVSMVIGSWPQQYPQFPDPSYLDLETARTLKEILKKLEAIDLKLGATDCKDELKKEFFDKLDKKLKDI